MSIITLTTDFGTKDPDVGLLKSRIIKKIPNANIIDISHELTPFDKEEALYIIKNSLREFPAKTMHFIGVDSETGKHQPPILILAHDQYFFANDNGLLPLVLQGSDYKAYKLPYKKPNCMMQDFIEAASLLLKGAKVYDFSVETTDLKKIVPTKLMYKYKDNSSEVALIQATVIYNDNYGNAVFNITKDVFEPLRKNRKFIIRAGHNAVGEILETYHTDKPEYMLTNIGTMAARWNHFGHLEVYTYKSNRQTGGANTILGLRKGRTLNIVFE